MLQVGMWWLLAHVAGSATSIAMAQEEYDSNGYDSPKLRFGLRRPCPDSVDELRIRARALKGYRVGELAACLGVMLPQDSRRAKGFVGQLLEACLGADPTAGERPDFPDLGVELKTLPMNGAGQPAESTFCCSIRMAGADREQWLTSRLRERLRCVLWLGVDGAREAALPQRRIRAVCLWRPSVEQWRVLREDWEMLMGAIGAGRGGTLSAREGEALQVRPKAAHAGVCTVVPSEYGAELAHPLGFYLRTSFTANIVREEI